MLPSCRGGSSGLSLIITSYILKSLSLQSSTPKGSQAEGVGSFTSAAASKHGQTSSAQQRQAVRCSCHVQQPRRMPAPDAVTLVATDV